jgi:hypothetical protein
MSNGIAEPMTFLNFNGTARPFKPGDSQTPGDHPSPRRLLPTGERFEVEAELEGVMEQVLQFKKENWIG